MTGKDKGKRFTEEQAREMVDAFKVRGIPANKFCKEYDISLPTLTRYLERDKKGEPLIKVGRTSKTTKPAQQAAEPKSEGVTDVLNGIESRLKAALKLAQDEEQALLTQLKTVRESIEKAKATMVLLKIEVPADAPESTLETEGD